MELPPNVERIDNTKNSSSNTIWPEIKLPDVLGVYEDDEYVIADISNKVSDNDRSQLIKKSNNIPVLEIYPMEINFLSEDNKIDLLNLYSFIDAYENFRSELLSNFNIILGSKPIKIAAMADSLPTETFQNVFSLEENTLYAAIQSVRNIVSGLPIPGVDVMRRIFSQLFQYTGMTAKGFMDHLSEIPYIGQAMDSAFQYMDNNVSYIKNLGSTARNIGNVAFLTNPINLPALWQSSHWDAKYTWNIRLYNPNPGDLKSTVQYLIGPLLVLLCLALPRSRVKNHLIYKPYICRFKMQGVCDIKVGYISSIDVIKGGNEGIQIGRNKVLGMIDLVVSFGSLYSLLPFLENYNPGELNSDVPNLHQWVQSLSDPFNVSNRGEESVIKQTILTSPRGEERMTQNTPKLYKERVPNP